MYAQMQPLEYDGVRQQTIEEFNNEIAIERHQLLTQIEKDVTFTAEACHILADHVENQASAIDESQLNLEIASDNVEMAAVDLCQAEKRVINWRWVKAGLVGAGVAMAVTVVAIVGVKASGNRP